MKSKLDFKFWINDEVKITDLDLKGRVNGIYIDADGTYPQYRVRYIYNGEGKTIYFYDYEIELTKNHTELGFK